MKQIEKTNIVTVIPNSNLNSNKHGVMLVLSGLYIGNKNTAIQETTNGKHLIHISSSLKGTERINYLARLLNIQGSIIDPKYQNVDIRITYWLNGNLTDKRKEYFARNFVQGSYVRDVVLEVTGYNVEYHQLEARWVNNGPVIKPDANNTDTQSNDVDTGTTETKLETTQVPPNVKADTVIKTSPQQSVAKQAAHVAENDTLCMEDLNLS